MKNSILTICRAVEHDYKDFIKSSYNSTAHYFIENAIAEDQGWLWFLTDDEIHEWEENPESRYHFVAEICDFLIRNFFDLPE